MGAWIFLVSIIALQSFSAHGRDILKLNTLDDQFWIYGKHDKEMRDDVGAPVVEEKEEVDDIFWIYRKKGNAVHEDMRPKNRGDNQFWIYAKKEADQVIKKDNARRENHELDPSLHVFFTVKDLKIGKTMPLYFPAKPDPSKSPRLLPREEAESIPFASSKLSYLFDYFSFSDQSPQAKAMAYTLKQCELEPIEGEAKFCATSLEAMLDRAHQIFGAATESRALTTTYISMKNTANPLKTYTILEAPKQVVVPRMIGCHPMPYPYAVFYCHSQMHSENKLFQVSLGGPNGERVEAVAACHMDTSKWDVDHVSFRVLNIEPRSAPVCHFFPVDNLIWVPAQSTRV